MEQDNPAQLEAAASTASAALANCIATFRLLEQAHSAGTVKLPGQLLGWVRDSQNHAQEAITAMGLARGIPAKAAA